MFIITFLFSLFLLFQKTIEFYNLKYGHIILDYYNTEDCVNKSIDKIVYSTIDEDNLTILNSENEIKQYEYSFDFFSSQIYYTNETGEESDEEKEYIYKRAFVCNGLCNKRQDNSDILLSSGNFMGDYQELNDMYKYYSCVYNNIIESATINITRFSELKCKTPISDYRFNGNQFCWKIDDKYSFRPLYFEDGNKKIYYHSYFSEDCTSEQLDFFQINENYIKCDNKCHKDSTDSSKSYKCSFKSGEYINFKKILLFLYLFLLFEMI